MFELCRYQCCYQCPGTRAIKVTVRAPNNNTWVGLGTDCGLDKVCLFRDLLQYVFSSVFNLRNQSMSKPVNINSAFPLRHVQQTPV